MIGRRQFITLLGGAAAWPLAASAQQPAMPVIGFLNSQSPGPFSHMVAGFLRGLNKSGFLDGKNVAIEYRWAEGQYDRLPALATELVRRGVTVLAATGGEPAALAAKAATATIPIVFTIGGDPVNVGLVESFNRPGGNATGLTLLTYQIEEKRIELLLELVPNVGSIGVLINPDFTTAEKQRNDIVAAAGRTGIRPHIAFARRQDEFQRAFTTFTEQRVNALLVAADPFFNSRRTQIVQLATQHKLPAIYEFREYPMAGGLISYGIDVVELYRQAGQYGARILKGARPAELPVLQPTKFQLVINLNTAKALGLTVPLTLQASADEVIE